ncbi:hypothetical protein [Streptomyces sp. NPDC056132]|uniref:hypothetical protein n=1 Tax=Streptomyces sp. NPDC056132 TaxID=3345722 RepID=UPI0035D7B212
MTTRPNQPIINTPEHHFGAIFLVIATRQPDDATLHAAINLIDSAATASWALRPDGLAPLTHQQYRQLLDYAAAPQVLDLALYLGGDRKQIRTLMDHIGREIAELLIHHQPPHTQA